MTLTLIHSPQSRSSSYIWLLEELGIPYDIRYVDIRRGDGSGGAASDNPHPHGKVPALLHDGVLIHEQVAIALYLTDLAPQAKLGPVVGDAKRGPYLTWLAYYAGVVEPSFVSAFMKVDVPRGTAGWVGVQEVVQTLEATLSKQPYLTGDQFTAADLIYGSTFTMFGQAPIMPKSDVIAAYAARCVDRPARARAQAKDAKPGG